MDIAILGAGVGGLSTAIALKQKGFNVCVYERGETISNLGAGIVCWPNASFVLDELGLSQDIQAVSGLPTRMQRSSDLGDSLGALDISALNQSMGYPSLSILRKDLMSILFAHAQAEGVDICFAHEATRIEQAQDESAHVVFSHGINIRADLIICADGRMNSIGRQYVNGDNSPVYQGFINWIGVYNSEKPCFDEIAVNDFWGVGKRFGIVPVSESCAYWAGALAAEDIAALDPDAYQHELLMHFSGWPDPIQTVIQNTPVADIHKIYVHDHDPIDCWHKENVLVIGDAAHAPLPTSGQGACQALEDAWHLADLLDRSTSDLSGLLQQFTARRQSKTSGITMGGRQFASSLFSQDEAYCKQRNENSAATDYAAVIQGMAKGWASGLPMSA